MKRSLKLYEHKSELLALADEIDPVLKKFGGGCARPGKCASSRISPIGGFIVLHLIYGRARRPWAPNAVNTACERLAPQVEAITGRGACHLRILSKPGRPATGGARALHHPPKGTGFR